LLLSHPLGDRQHRSVLLEGHQQFVWIGLGKQRSQSADFRIVRSWIWLTSSFASVVSAALASRNIGSFGGPQALRLLSSSVVIALHIQFF
jgi:hypothetical protein